MPDPRFDPAFQRGYSGPEPELVVRTTAPRRAEPDATPQPADTDAAADSTPARTLGPEPAADPDAHSGPEPALEPPRLSPNPFRLALLILGPVLLLAAGSILFEQVQHPNSFNTTLESQFLNLLIYDLPPALALAGFVCVILWLALGALDRVHDDVHDEESH